MGRRIQTLALAVALASGSCTVPYVYDKPNPLYQYVQKGKRWFYIDYTFTPTHKEKVKNENYLPNLHPAYVRGDIRIKDFKGRRVKAREFVKRSIRDPKARTYVNKGLEQIIKDHKDGKIKLEGELALAKYAVEYFWRDLSKDKGHGCYTDEREGLKRNFHTSVTLPSYMKTTIYFENRDDRRLTLAEFIAQPKGKKAKKCYYGDCDDFAMALLSSYEIMRDMAKKRTDKFSKALYKQLQRFQVVYAVETGHAINFIILYNKDFTNAKVLPIEPQIFKRDHLEQNAVVSTPKCLVHIKRIRYPDRIKVEKRDIYWFYNSQESYFKSNL